ncbi:MAG: Uma2 family endonuclease [Dehalococcoidia bacterium]
MTTPTTFPIRMVAQVPDAEGDYIGDRHLSFEDYLGLDSERGLAEWVDGRVHVYVGPSAAHHIVLMFLMTVFGGFVHQKGGRMIQAGYVMKATPSGNARMADIIVILPAHTSRITDYYLDGPADLVVEIVDDRSQARDYEVKRDEYEASGIPEYWIVDPREGKRSVTLLVLRDGRYVEVPADGDVVYSRVLDGFWLRLEWLWERHPDAMGCLKRVLSGPAT